MATTNIKCLLASFVGACLLSITPCVAQPTVSAKVDEFIKAEMRRQRIPGLSLAVIRDGRTIVAKGYGLANVEHQIPVKPETVFQSGSIGKQFTATAIMILVEEGRLSLDDKISKHFADTPASWKNITVRHLLTHTSGMADFPPDFDVRRDYTDEELFAYIKAVPLTYQTGAKWDYTAFGYVFSGILVRRLTGKFYGDFLRERVFQPLGMKTARVISEADIIPNRAAGYRLVDGELKNQEWVSPSTNTTADGSLHHSILDLAKWDAALYTDKPLKQSSLAQMWMPVNLSDGTTKAYGFGWHTDEMRGRRIVYHGGAWQGFKSFIVRFPDDKLTIIFFANLWETNEVRLARGLIAKFYPEFAPPLAQPLEDKEPKVTASVRRVLLQFAKGTTGSNLFTTEARAEIFPDRAEQIGKQLNLLSNPIAIIYSSELIERREEHGGRVYLYMLNDLGTTLFCKVKLTKDDKIANLQLRSE